MHEHGLPESFSRSTQYRARKKLCGMECNSGPQVLKEKIALSGGKEHTIAFQNPFAFIHYHGGKSKDYAMIMRAAIARKPPSHSDPWRLIIYQDGVNPSDGLAKNLSRKSCVFYWAFAELGAHALCHEEVWGISTLVRNTICKEMPGNIGDLANKVLQTFFNPEHDMRTSGVTFTLMPTANGETLEVARLFTKICIVVADEPALKEIFDCKGHAGHICCLLCANATLHKAPGGGIPFHIQYPAFCKSIALNRKLSDFKLHDNQSMRESLRKVNNAHDDWIAGLINKNEFEHTSQIVGYNWSPNNILLNERFNVLAADSVMFDWSHVFICDGVADVEFGSCMSALRSATATST